MPRPSRYGSVPGFRALAERSGMPGLAVGLAVGLAGRGGAAAGPLVSLQVSLAVGNGTVAATGR